MRKNICASIFSILLIGCQFDSKREHSSNDTVITENGNKNGSEHKHDSGFFKQKKRSVCSSIRQGNVLLKKRLTQNDANNIIHRMDFLSDFVKFYNVDSIELNRLMQKDYYDYILSNTHFLDFNNDQLSISRIQFNLFKKDIPGYGFCYIGLFFHPDAPNAAQRTACVIINTDRKEISIWYFDKIEFTSEGINCNFNLKGSHTIYEMRYSKVCNEFIPISSVLLKAEQ